MPKKKAGLHATNNLPSAPAKTRWSKPARNVWTVEEKESRYRAALHEAIAEHTVVIFTHGNRGVGTGVLVDVDGAQALLTAAHNLEGTPLTNLRIKGKGPGGLKEGTPDMAMWGKKEIELFAGFTAPLTGQVFIDEKNDIALLPLSNTAQDGSAYALPRQNVDLADGVTVIRFGFPTDNHVAVNQEARLLCATTDSSSYSTELRSRTDLHSCYDQRRHFVVEYTRAEDGIDARGFSGSGAWCNLKCEGPIWRPVPFLLGIVTRYHRPHELIQITDLDQILNLADQMRHQLNRANRNARRKRR